MIIDLILDRKDGVEYSPKRFYDGVSSYGAIGYEIATALDSGTENDVKKTLHDYIKQQEYPSDISIFIDSVNWL